MSEVDKCKDVPITGQTKKEDIDSQGNLLEYNYITKSCTIGEKHLGNNLKVVDNKLEYKNKFYKSLPKKAHCNMYGIEKWQDWFTIPYYFINNKYQQATNEENKKCSYSVSTCYKYCGDEYVVKKNIDKCESINTFERGIYKEILMFDPFAIICIICTKHDNGTTKKYKELELEGSYEYNLENFILPDNIKPYIQRNGQPTPSEKKEAYESIEGDVKTAHDLIVKYISDIVSNEERNDISIRNKIVNDVNRFYDLFDSRDKYYIEYLKKIKATDSPGFGNYQGARFAYELAQNFKKSNATDATYGVTITHADPDVIKYIRFLLIYCCNLCFSDKYLLRERLENFTIITSYEKLQEKDDKGDILSGKYEPISEEEGPPPQGDKESPTTNTFNINKEEITVFEEYSYVFKYFKNLSILGPFLLLLIMIIFLGYFILDRLLLLGRFLTIFNYIYLYIINLLMNLMYYTATGIIRILGALIINPIYMFSLKIPVVIITILSMFVALLVISSIPGLDFVKDLAFMILDFVYILIVQLVMLFINLIVIIASNIMFSVPATIFIVYTMYKLTYEQIGIITSPHLDYDPFIRNIILIYFIKMRNEYYINFINNHIKLIEAV
jgi:hypothetical protein